MERRYLAQPELGSLEGFSNVAGKTEVKVHVVVEELHKKLMEEIALMVLSFFLFPFLFFLLFDGFVVLLLGPAGIEDETSSERV